jgi:hypothetical protein
MDGTLEICWLKFEISSRMDYFYIKERMGGLKNNCKGFSSLPKEPKFKKGE